MEKAKIIWIGYTTQYREGGARFQQAAHTKAAEIRRQCPELQVICSAVDSKREFVKSMATLLAKSLKELHFFGHSGMYGPMFRTAAMPEQFSPHEWRSLILPFSTDAEAYFHCCRSGRWFASFFARTFEVPTWGYRGYTTISLHPYRYRWEGWALKRPKKLYVLAIPGKKSHGWLGALGKHSGLLPPETMTRYLPQSVGEQASYQQVAALYDQAFQDIRVRRREVAWLDQRLESGSRVLEIGCGNGALLTHLAPRIRSGMGVDSSNAMLQFARSQPHLQFQVIDGPILPADNQSIDVVISMLSWRYLDWDPLMAEIRRVLAPGGRLLVVDMVALPAQLREWWHVGRDLISDRWQERQWKHYASARKRLTNDPHWKEMLQYNPIRAEHEYRWYFESRFPGRHLETLSRSLTSRIVAFDSGPLQPGYTPPQSYP